ncbi:Far1-related sequence like, partial [Thalictrum thalictroides]
LGMEGKKLITICQFGGEFESNDEDGTLLYNGGEAHAIDIDHETLFEDFKLEIIELLKCSSGSAISMKYFLPGNRKTLITISNDKDFKRMIDFNGGSAMVDVFVTVGEREEIVAHDSPVQAGDTGENVSRIGDAPATRCSRKDVIEEANHAKNVPSSWETAITGVNQRFSDAREFREALRKYAFAHRFSYKLEKNHCHRVTAKCKSENCPWKIHAARLLTTPFFRIKTMNSTHTCEGGLGTKGSAAINWVADIVKEKMQDSPKYRPKDIVNDIKREYGIELKYSQAWRRKEIARAQLKGSYKESYSELPFLCEKIAETNPGSLAIFTTKDGSSFHRLFISFHASLHGFELGCRPLLFLDNLPLNSRFKESLLVATALDGDDGVFPVAFAVVDEENVDNWRWFLRELKSAILTSRFITIVAEAAKGLTDLIPEVFENGHHGYCLRYLSENFREALPKKISHEVKRLLVADFNASAYALKVEDFQRITGDIKDISPEAFSWIEHKADELPITQKVDMIRINMMELIYTRSMDSSQWLTRLTPSMEGKLQSNIFKAHSLEHEVTFTPNMDNIFEVRGDSVEMVDIDQWSCSCKAWQITGLPCFHAVAVFECIDRSPYDYCSKYFTTDSYRLTYSELINPVPTMEKPTQKESSQASLVITPPSRPPRGRSRIHRIDRNEVRRRQRAARQCLTQVVDMQGS